MAWLMIPAGVPSACSPESGESITRSGHGAGQYVMSRLIPTPSERLAKTWQAVILMLRRSGMTLQLSDEPNLTPSGASSASPQGSPAKISATPVKVPVLKETDPDFSSKLSGSFSWLDRKSFSWKTPQRSLLEGWTSFLGKWPKAGIMRHGVCYPLPSAEHRIAEIDGGCSLTGARNHHVSTPTASDYISRESTSTEKLWLYWVVREREKLFSNATDPEDLVNKDGLPPSPGEKLYDRRTGAMRQTALTDSVKLWPTPTVNMISGGANHTAPMVRRGAFGLNLKGAIQMYPAPNAMDGARGADARDRDGVGQLNPDWVEWLQGFPVGWTDLEASAIPWFRSVQGRPSSY